LPNISINNEISSIQAQEGISDPSQLNFIENAARLFNP
jgi:hypothetical protein